MNTRLTGYGYDGAKVEPLTEREKRFAELLSNFIEDKEILEKERRSIPDYTGQWSPSDYTASAEASYNDSVRSLLKFIKE